MSAIAFQCALVSKPFPAAVDPLPVVSQQRVLTASAALIKKKMHLEQSE